MFTSNIMKQVFVNMLLALEAIKEDKHKLLSVFDQNSQISLLHSSKLMVRNSYTYIYTHLSYILLKTAFNQ